MTHDTQGQLFPNMHARPGIECPKCGSGTRVAQTRNQYERIVRERICTNPECRHVFDTVERIRTAKSA